MDKRKYSQDSPNYNWPFQPRWLSIRDGVSESEVNPNTDGLFVPDTLRGFMAESSDMPEIDNPISLFQVLPSNYILCDPYERIEPVTSQDEYIKKILRKPLPRGWDKKDVGEDNWKIIRIDPGKLYKNKVCCDEFRKCENGACKNKCFNLDSRIALFYDERLDNIHYFGDNARYIKTFKQIVEEYNQTLGVDEKGQKDEPVIPVDNTEIYDERYKKSYVRLYVNYRCKYSGLDEYFFPIFHSGKVIAVIMQGQRPNSQMSTYPMFEKYLNDAKAGTGLKESLDKLKQDATFFEAKSLSERRKGAIFNQIVTFAQRVNNNVNLLSHQYISRQFQDLEKEFRGKLKNLDSKEIGVFDKFKQVLNQTLHNIFYTFNENGFIRIYSFKSTMQKQGIDCYEFELIGNSVLDSEVAPYSNLTFSNIPIASKNRIEGKELINALEEDKRKYVDENHTFRLEVSFVLKMSYIVWKSYDINRSKHSSQLRHYGDNLKLFYHVLLEPYIILNEVHFEDLLEKSIRVSIHETAQVIPPVIQTLKSYFDKKEKDGEKEQDYYNRIKEEFINSISKSNDFKELSKKIYDINNRLELLDGLYQRSALIFKKIEPSFEWEDFHRIIFSIKSLFEEKAFLNNRQEIFISFEYIYSKLDILTNKNFITQIIFNLVDNAIKYGLRGSKINIKVRMTDGQKDLLSRGIIGKLEGQSLQIIIENFGNEINKDTREKLFDLYYRDPYNLASEGLGIGLFLVKKLCDSLHYSIRCEQSEKIGDINYPIYYHAQKEDKNKLEKKYLPVIGSSLNINIDRTVNKTELIDWEITTEELNILLDYPVYSNKFTLNIPINSSNIKINR